MGTTVEHVPVIDSDGERTYLVKRTPTIPGHPDKAGLSEYRTRDGESVNARDGYFVSVHGGERFEPVDE